MPAIAFEHVDLDYPIREHHGVTLKDFVLRGLFRHALRPMKSVHALRDLSFTVGDGERVGILGNNGAGKTTLLRAVAGIYPVTRGTRRVEGTLCSLLDYAVGFEMEETGRQNIRYRCYLQGESPRSVERKLDEIAEFAELGEFLDVPLRCYSVGMILRLAFAIATSCEPEILLLDEFFFTSDLGFRRRGEERLRDFLHRASIVVMVGHDLHFLEEFCTRVLWLEKGRVVADGPPAEIVPRYTDAALQPA
jgi:ABC-type polysaccharide/polyol phosphate transport system ATPase subunit